MTIDQIVLEARRQNCSDVHITEGMDLIFRIHGSMERSGIFMSDQETEDAIFSMLDENQREKLKQGFDIDFSLTSSDGNRQRVNVFRQQGKVAATIRLLNNKIPTLDELKLPSILREMAEKPRGLILVTGPTGRRPDGGRDHHGESG